MRNFRNQHPIQGIDIFKTQKKFYKTLELKIAPLQNTNRSFREKEERPMTNAQKNLSVPTKSKFPQRHERIFNQE